MTESVSFLEEQLDSIKGKILKVEEAMEQLIAANNTLNTNYLLLKSIKGIGIINAIVLLYGGCKLRRCVKKHTFFFSTKPRLSQAGALFLPKDFVSLSIKIYTYGKDTFSSLHSQPNCTFFRKESTKIIAENDPVRMVDALVENLNLEGFRKLYKECGRSPYHPKMMLKRLFCMPI